MFAVDPPPIVAPASHEKQPDIIEVIGARSGQALKIDRRTYNVQQNPHAAQKDAVQLVRGLPAVTISPDGGVMLLGSGGVQIFVNGRPYRGDAKRYLLTLHGTDIERIEIITNPSAQYSAEGTGGIVNFVLRRQRGKGISGSASAEVSSLGHLNADATAKYKHGRWTYEVEAHGGDGRISSVRYHRSLSVQEAPADVPTVNGEDGQQSSGEIFAEVSGKVTYDIDTRTSVSAKIDGGGYRSNASVIADFVGLTPDFASVAGRQRSTHASSLLNGQLNFDRKGRKEGETLMAAIDFYSHPISRDVSVARFSNGETLSTNRLHRLVGVFSQIDWQHPVGGKLLSMGGSWNHRRLTERYTSASTGGEAAMAVVATDRYQAADDTLAAYATFQQPIGSWAVMPGIRVERNSRAITSPDIPDVTRDRTDVFPTLHLEHRLGKAVDLTLSYSKRIDRAQEEKLRPYRTVENVLTSTQGNPHLRDQSTDAYEVNLHYHRKSVDAGVVLYDRETSRLWSADYTGVDRGTAYTWINAGHRRDRGAEFDLSTPIVRRVKASMSLNLFEERTPTAASVGATTDERFRYTSNTTLEWNGSDRGDVPGDVAQLQWTYNSPSREFQLRNAASASLSLSCTHSFSRGVSLTGTITYATDTCRRLVAPLVRDHLAQRSPAEFKLKLLKTFGNL